ncbi:MAG: RNA 2',3'-cyclic phosphodiesterase [Chloroflexota bacterium]|nr:RNA 2',3'-cyclic phosphodiesterase [Chloroflexota bacterium]MDQ5866261.1 RNA 2',3'-cyclic phosphodiesterase [Chloroflexota bacterium]
MLTDTNTTDAADMADNTSTTRSDRARLFVAIELPQDILQVLEGIQAQTRENLGEAASLVRWSRTEGIHVTLQFLGEVPASRIPEITAALQQACAGKEPFALEVGGLGAFPNVRKPRVVWVGLGGDTPAVIELAAAVQEALGALGFKADKPFSPHMTIGRVREGIGIGRLTPLSRVLSLTRTILPEQSSFQVSGVSLMQSFMQSGGSVYKQVAHVALGTDGQAAAGG